MFSGFLPNLDYVNWSEDRNRCRIWPDLRSFQNLWSYFGEVCEAVVVMVSFVFQSFLTKRILVHGSCYEAPVIISHQATGDEEGLTFVDAVTWPWSLMDDDDVETVQDSQLSTSQKYQMTNSTVIRAPSPQVRSSIREDEEFRKPSQIFCEICMEKQEKSQMITNYACSHSFCYDCTVKYIMSKVQDNTHIITCPAISCKAMLDSNTLRNIIPKDIVLRWDESLCKSLFKESRIVYCPFRDCSAMLINDTVEVVCQTTCPECKRSFCAQCVVPWHSEFSCKKFLKLSKGKTRKGVDEYVLVEKLAKKKKWRKCPSCKMYVEKNEGCLHITCRCSYQFCYNCGSRWSSIHYGCKRKSIAMIQRILANW